MTPENLNARIASAYGVRNATLGVRANQSASAIEKLIQRAWRELSTVAQSRSSYRAAHARALQILDALFSVVKSDLQNRLEATAKWSHRSSADTLLSALPNAAYTWIVASKLAKKPVRTAEQTGSKISITLGRPNTLRDWWNLGWETFSREKQQRILSQYVFEPLPYDRIKQLIKTQSVFRGSSVGWVERLTTISTLARNKNELAHKLASSVSTGESPRQTLETILPLFRGYVPSAKRIASMETRRVAHLAAEETWQQMREVVGGYQIHEIMDLVTRPHHAARNGKIWAEDDKTRPTLPDDYNCRGWFTPVLSIPKDVLDDPSKIQQFRNVAAPQQENAVYDQWWDSASEEERVFVVGAKRYFSAKQSLGNTPRFGDFVDPVSGELIDMRSLGGQAEILSRRAANAIVFARRAAELSQTGEKSFLDPQPIKPRKQIGKAKVKVGSGSGGNVPPSPTTTGSNPPPASPTNLKQVVPTQAPGITFSRGSIDLTNDVERLGNEIRAAVAKSPIADPAGAKKIGNQALEWIEAQVERGVKNTTVEKARIILTAPPGQFPQDQLDKAKKVMELRYQLWNDSAKRLLLATRDLGGPVHFSGPSDSLNLLNQAIRELPTDWVARSAKKGQFNVIHADNPSSKTSKDDRAYYCHSDLEMALSKRNKVPTAIHEFIHRIQFTFSNFLKIDVEYYDSRTKGQPKQIYDSKRNHYTIPDKWLHLYMGLTHKKEVASMTIETILGNKQFAALLDDRETVSVYLGMLLGL